MRPPKTRAANATAKIASTAPMISPVVIQASHRPVRRCSATVPSRADCRPNGEQARGGGSAVLLDDAEQVALRVGEHDEVLVRLWGPRIPVRSQSEEPVDLGVPIVRVEIEAEPILPDPRLGHDLQRDVHARARWIAEHDPVGLRLVPRDVASASRQNANARSKSLQSMTTEPTRTAGVVGSLTA